MNRLYRNIVVTLVGLGSVGLMTSCDIQSQWDLDVPVFSDSSRLIHTTPLTVGAKYAIEGIYRIIAGNDMFGDTMVVKQTRDKISFFGLKNSNYFILGTGSLNSKIIFEGYWRYAQEDKTGLARLQITGADNLLLGDTLQNNITISGVYGNESKIPDKPFEMSLIKRFTPRLRADKFIIGAHRGGGRTSDRLPVSENSVEMVNYTEYFGSTGVEVDVTLTLDKIPVLYHDDDLNIRLIQKGPIYGRIQDYTFKQLRTFVKLIHGENIPSLQELLDAVILNTNLTCVWLDIKDAESLDQVIPIQQQALTKAAKLGRDLEIWVGVPSDDVYNKLVTFPYYRDIPSLCELSGEKVDALNSRAWAFRWTLGLQEEEVMNMHARGHRCLVWTLDVPEFAKIYTLQGGSDPRKRFDGILTNYPSLIAYYHYVRHNF
jgi:glycerophosphoryl diester phosphodiesterase